MPTVPDGVWLAEFFNLETPFPYSLGVVQAKSDRRHEFDCTFHCSSTCDSLFNKNSVEL